jgi:hypothetical protein
MERVLNLNTNQTKQAIYRGLTPLIVKEDSKFIEKKNFLNLRLAILLVKKNTCDFNACSFFLERNFCVSSL